MKFCRIVLSAFLVTLVSVFCCNTVDAHSVFKKEMAKKYPEKKISCNACHVKGEKKDVRNAFGNLFAQEFKDLALSKNREEKEIDARKVYEETVMVPAFTKALEKITAMTVDQMIEAGGVAEIENPDSE